MLEIVVSLETDHGGNASFSKALETWKIPSGNGKSALLVDHLCEIPLPLAVRPQLLGSRGTQTETERETEQTVYSSAAYVGLSEGSFV